MSVTAQAGDLVQLQGSGFRSHLVRLEAGAVLQRIVESFSMMTSLVSPGVAC